MGHIPYDDANIDMGLAGNDNEDFNSNITPKISNNFHASVSANNLIGNYQPLNDSSANFRANS